MTSSQQAVPEPPLAAPAQNSFSRGLGASGIIEAIRENTNAGVPLPGLVMGVPVKVWDKVKPGDLLIKLDDREVRAQINTQQAELALRGAELARARRQHDSLAGMNAGGWHAKISR